MLIITVTWHGLHGVSDHRPIEFVWINIKDTSQNYFTGSLWRESTGDWWIPPQRVSNAKSVPWHYVNMDKSVKYCSEGVNNGDHLTPVLQRGLYWCIVIFLLTHWHLGHLDTIFKIQFSIFVLLIGILRSNHALRWMPRDPTDDKSTLVQVMPWCRQALIHYLRQCSPRSIPYGVTRPRWVK